jgi:hypothetical protein
VHVHPKRRRLSIRPQYCHSPKTILWAVAYIREHCLNPLPAVLQCYVLVISIQSSESPHIFVLSEQDMVMAFACSSIRCSYKSLTSRFQFTHCVQRDEQTSRRWEHAATVSQHKWAWYLLWLFLSTCIHTEHTEHRNAAGIETRLRAGRAGVESLKGKEIFVFSKTSRPDLRLVANG